MPSILGFSICSTRSLKPPLIWNVVDVAAYRGTVTVRIDGRDLVLGLEAARRIWGNGDPQRYYTFIGASAFVFTAEQECRRLFGCSPLEHDFVERHADFVVTLLLEH